MPKKANTWENCIIYKLWNEDDFYIGSTTDFACRKRHHKSNCNNEKSQNYNLKLYQLIREKGGWDAWSIIPLEEYKDCKNQTEARIREEEWRVKTNASLNMRRAYRSDELKKESLTRYREQNHEKIAEINKQYREQNREKISQYREQNRDKQSQYREQNREKIAEKREQNRDKTNEKRRANYQKKLNVVQNHTENTT